MTTNRKQTYIFFGPTVGQCLVFGGALVQWLKLPAWKVGDFLLEPRSCIQVSKKQDVFFPLTRKDSILWGASAADRQSSYFEFCVWRAVSYHSSHHPQPTSN